MIQLQTIGNLAADAERKDINGRSYMSFRIAANTRRGGKEETTWVSVLTGMRDGLFQYLKKGVKVYVHGDMNVTVYQRKTGETGVDVSCFASTLELCGGGVTASPEQENATTGKTGTNNTTLFDAMKSNDEIPF